MQQQQATSWWIGRDRKDFRDEAARRFPDMAKSAEARGIDATQGLRESKGGKAFRGSRSGIRLES